jgi:hypothetical protein
MIEDTLQVVFLKRKSSAASMAVNEGLFTIPSLVPGGGAGGRCRRLGGGDVELAVTARLNWAKLVAWQTLSRPQFAYHLNVGIRAMPYWPLGCHRGACHHIFAAKVIFA